MKNLTPHDVSVVGVNGEPVTFPRDGRVARAATLPQTDIGTAHGVQLVSPQVFTAAEGVLPDDGDIIVSVLVAPLLGKHAGRVFVPDTGPGQAIRDAAGQITAVRRLIEYPRESGLRAPHPAGIGPVIAGNPRY